MKMKREILKVAYKNSQPISDEIMKQPAIDNDDSKLVDEYISHLASIVEFSEDAIISKSLDGTIKSWNRGSEKMFGYTSGEMIGKNISLIIPTEFIDDERKIFNWVTQNKFIQPYETSRVKRNGDLVNVSLTVSPLKDRAGNIIGASVISRDITLRKQADEALLIANKELAFQNEEKEKRAAELVIANKELLFQNKEKEKHAAELVIANKELLFQNEEKEKHAAELVIANKELLFQHEEKKKRAAELVLINHELTIAETRLKEVNEELEAFTYSVAHDLRAPLRAVNSYAKILEEDYGEAIDSDGKQVLQRIQHNAAKMGSLIDELLAFSRLGRKELNKSEIDMNNLVQSVVDDYKRATTHHATIQIGPLPNVNADPTLLYQVLLNLLSNAIKYSAKKEHPLIEIGTEEQDNKTVFIIKDNGAGFDMRFANKLFGVFQRLHSEKEFEGNGVGLAIVQRIIFKHGGHVWAEGKENEGAIFYFTLN